MHQDKDPVVTNDEPKISELEETFRIFKDAHGHSRLMDIISDMKSRLIPKAKKIKPRTADKTEGERYSEEKKVGVKIVKKPTGFYKFNCALKRVYIFLRKKLGMKRYRYPSIALGVFFGIYLIFNLPTIYTRLTWKDQNNSQQVIVKTDEIVKRKTASPASLASGEVIPHGSRLVISKIKVNAPVIFATSTNEKKIQEELHSGVVHYKGTAMPGEVGNTFITGHSSNYWWDTGKYNYVFVLLDKLEVGDKAIVYHEGKKFVYTVRSKAVVDAKSLNTLVQTKTPTMTLMTCTPPGTSWKRLVVKLDRTDPAFYKPTTVTRHKIVNIDPRESDTSLWEKVMSFIKPN